MANYHGHRNNKLAKDFINKKTGSMLTSLDKKGYKSQIPVLQKLNCRATYQFMV